MNKTQIYQEVVDYFGDQTKTAALLSVKQPTASGWVNGKHKMSAGVALRVERLSGGKFLASQLCDDLIDMQARAEIT